jgi:hypothetical protein
MPDPDYEYFEGQPVSAATDTATSSTLTIRSRKMNRQGHLVEAWLTLSGEGTIYGLMVLQSPDADSAGGTTNDSRDLFLKRGWLRNTLLNTTSASVGAGTDQDALEWEGDKLLVNVSGSPTNWTLSGNVVNICGVMTVWRLQALVRYE